MVQPPRTFAIAVAEFRGPLWLPTALRSAYVKAMSEPAEIVVPDRPMLIVHSRVSETTFTTRLISDAGEPLRLAPPGLSLKFSEILAG